MSSDWKSSKARQDWICGQFTKEGLAARVMRLEDERSALAAHMERQADLLSWARDMLTHDTVAARKWHTAVNSAECETPTTSLARLKAEWQAEILMEYHQYRKGAQARRREPMSAHEWASEVLERSRQAGEEAP